MLIGGCFIVYAEISISGPAISLSSVSLHTRIASIVLHPLLGESPTESLSSRSLGISPNILPSIRIRAALLYEFRDIRH